MSLHLFIFDPETSWAKEAACKNVEDPDIFFPERGGRARKAKSVCAECPVRLQCLEENLDEVVGIWGGTTEKERRRLKKRRVA